MLYCLKFADKKAYFYLFFLNLKCLGLYELCSFHPMVLCCRFSIRVGEGQQDFFECLFETFLEHHFLQEN